MNSSRWTQTVMRKLTADMPDNVWEQVWEHLWTPDYEAFKRNAKAYLGDKTELGVRSIEDADWPGIHAYFAVLSAKEKETVNG